MSYTNLIRKKDFSEIVYDNLPSNYKIYVVRSAYGHAIYVISYRTKEELFQLISKVWTIVYIEDAPFNCFVLDYSIKLQSVVPEHYEILDIANCDRRIEQRTIDLYNSYIQEAEALEFKEDEKEYRRNVEFSVFAVLTIFFAVTTSFAIVANADTTAIVAFFISMILMSCATLNSANIYTASRR